MAESTEDPIVITDYIGMPTYCGPMYLSEKTIAMLESQPIRPSDIDLSKIKLPTEEMMMDIEEGGGPGYSDETFVNHPNPGMLYVAPPAPPHPSVFLPKKTPEQLKAQAASVAARLSAAKAVLKAGNKVQVEEVLVFKRPSQDTPASGDS